MTNSDVVRLPAARTGALAGSLRFGAVGVGGMAVNLVVLHVLYGLAHLPILLASGLAVESAVIHNYLLNDHWTYRQSRPSLGRFVRFNLSTLVTLLMNVIVVWGLVGSGFDYVWANLVGIGCGAVLNFGASSAWVWRGSFR